MQGTQVRSLVRELRSLHTVQCSQIKKLNHSKKKKKIIKLILVLGVNWWTHFNPNPFMFNSFSINLNEEKEGKLFSFVGDTNLGENS